MTFFEGFMLQGYCQGYKITFFRDSCDMICLFYVTAINSKILRFTQDDRRWHQDDKGMHQDDRVGDHRLGWGDGGGGL